MKGEIFAIYKESGITSHDVIDKVRRITGVKKVGHAGTLDPLARGVLVVGVGRDATRRLHQLAGEEKEYVATIRLGATSDTDDAEGPVHELSVAAIPPSDVVMKLLGSFTGLISQRPPRFSAIKVNGRCAYKLARAGKKFELPQRKVLVKHIDMLSYDWPYLKIRVVTGAGVYIRALARDIGEKLGTGGYLAELERTRVGSYTKDKALTLSELKKIAQNHQSTG